MTCKTFISTAILTLAFLGEPVEAAHAAGTPEGLVALIGLGIGPSNGIAGANWEFGFRHRSGTGVTADLGTGLLATLGVRVWLPGQKLRLGLGPTIGTDWGTVAGMVGGDCDDGRTSVFLAGGSVDLDHDIGRPGAFGMRYGLWGGVIAGGCAGAAGPLPVVSLNYAF